MAKVYFENIQAEVLAGISTATKQLKIAVAWFTNEKIFDALISKQDEGISVSLIIIDDYINNGDYGLDFQKFIDKGGKLFYGTPENPMHHKFCIIDDSTLFTGSYNWTYFAEYKNHENIVKFESGADIIKPYVIEFNRLLETLPQVLKANKVLLEEIELKDIFSVKNYLAMDLVYNAKQNLNFDLLDIAINISPDIKTLLEEYKSLKPLQIVESPPANNLTIPHNSIKVKPQIVIKSSIGIKSILEGVRGRFSSIVEKGQTIPCEMSHTYNTVADNQTQMLIETFKGENEMADKNIRLGSFLIKDLPKKPAGEASVEVTIIIQIDGNLVVKAKSLETGNEIEANYYDNSLV